MSSVTTTILPTVDPLDLPADQFAADVSHYLAQQPRQLPSRYLYDALGSALFDAICRLPWYHVTRAETGLLAKYSREILSAIGPISRVVELGAGNGDKLAQLLSARNPVGPILAVHLVDVSRSALDIAAATIGAVGNVNISTHQSRFVTWLESAKLEGDAGALPHERTLALFLGSNIGNFDPPAADALLQQVRATLSPGSALLIGTDLVKPEPELLLAYDDPLGVTAAFNLNLLVRINQELGAHIDISNFRHHALWNSRDARVEMHLVCRRAHRLHIPAADVDIVMQRDESIWTESSHKYRTTDLSSMLERSGFHIRAQWLDTDSGFALSLAEVLG